MNKKFVSLIFGSPKCETGIDRQVSQNIVLEPFFHPDIWRDDGVGVGNVIRN